MATKSGKRFQQEQKRAKLEREANEAKAKAEAEARAEETKAEREANEEARRARLARIGVAVLN